MTHTREAVIDASTAVPLTHAEGMALFATELQRHLDLMHGLGEAAWASQTEIGRASCRERV